MNSLRNLVLPLSLCVLAACEQQDAISPAGDASAVVAQDDLNIPFEEFTLENGLRVIVHEDHKAPIIATNLWYHVGSKNENPGKTGFAHLFEHLMFNGTENYDDEYFGPFQEVGATNMNGTTNKDRTNYYQTVPTSALDLALWMESDRMENLLPVLTQKKLDNQRKVVKNERRQNYEDRPYGIVSKHMAEALYPPGHPYHHLTIGSHADLTAASLDDVKAAYVGGWKSMLKAVALYRDGSKLSQKQRSESIFPFIS